ncbi:MAG: hypothetical protein MI861_20335 [Pirellulales bacterium]|nr:hypothetical protein [Pirellulales bacterium]
MSESASKTPIHSTRGTAPAMAINRAVLAHRAVQTGILLGLVWKLKFFSLAIQAYDTIPIFDDFFPRFLQSALVVRLAYLGTIVTVGANLLTGSRFLQRWFCIQTLFGLSILCLHQTSYNDVTFVTAWWTSLWSVWYVHHMDDADQTAMLRRAALLSRLIISMIMLGGAVGKWTSEYWSGEVFYDIYFRDRDFWLFNLLRRHCENDTLHVIAKWYSRHVIVTETVAGFFLWLLPPRWAATIGVVLLASIALLSNFLLFSVLMSLIGLASVGFFVPPTKPATGQ